ncbi:MAG: TIGR01777 family oxidoreductase [Candidatus Dormibacteraeota bacterium]|nr:TIGR01777 family oxidoreductase [Candidatus Dormibacteraeota bacterium]
MKVLISGGSGFIGSHLVASLAKDGHGVVVLSRCPPTTAPPSGVRYVTWDARSATGEWVNELSGAQAVVNLAGASIGSWPWTRRRMAELLSSRLSATAALVQALERTPAGLRPPVLVSASGIDYYGDRGDESITEDSHPGDSFLATLSQQWEAAAQKAEPLGLRVVRIRTAMVFGREASAFRLLTLPFRLFAGGPLGNGRQWFTWIHIDDMVGLYRQALEDARVSGPVNAVAPDIRRERDVAIEIGRVLHRPALIPAPAFALKLVLGKEAELLLHGRRAEPAKARGYGYHFRFAGLHEALEETLRRR